MLDKKAEAFKLGFKSEIDKKIKEIDEKLKDSIEEKMSTEPSDIGAIIGGTSGAAGGLSGAYNLTKGLGKNRRILSLLAGGLGGMGTLGSLGYAIGRQFDEPDDNDNEEADIRAS